MAKPRRRCREDSAELRVDHHARDHLGHDRCAKSAGGKGNDGRGRGQWVNGSMPRILVGIGEFFFFFMRINLA